MEHRTKRNIIVSLAIIVILAAAGFGYKQLRERPKSRQALQSQTKLDPRIEAAFAPKACADVPTLDVPAGSYQGPMIDTHFHPPSLPEPGFTDREAYFRPGTKTLLGVNITMSEIACLFKRDGTAPKNILAFWPIFPDIYKDALEVVRQTNELYPGLFVPFINPPDNDGHPDGFPTVDAAMLDTMLSVYPGLFKGYGELGLYARQGGAPALSPDSPRLQAIYPVLRKHHINKVFFHLGEGQKEAFDTVLRENRDMTFIFHGDQLISYKPDGTQDISAIEYLLERNPNVVYGVDELWGDVFLLNEKGSKEAMKAHFKDYEPLLEKDMAIWKPFIERFPDQVLWDTDRGTYLWTMDLEVGQMLVQYVRAFIGKLEPKVQEKYAYKNAERILQE